MFRVFLFVFVFPFCFWEELFFSFRFGFSVRVCLEEALFFSFFKCGNMWEGEGGENEGIKYGPASNRRLLLKMDVVAPDTKIQSCRKNQRDTSQAYIWHAQQRRASFDLLRIQQKVVLRAGSGLPEDCTKFHLPVALWQCVRTTQPRARTCLHC